MRRLLKLFVVVGLLLIGGRALRLALHSSAVDTVATADPEPHLITDNAALPNLDAEGYCKKMSSTWASPSEAYRNCIADQQAAYYHAGDSWNEGTATDRFRCTNLATLEGGTFVVLNSCLTTLEDSGN
jgi:hypothetical protein